MNAFQVQWSDQDMGRMKAMVAACRLPQVPAASGWELGCDPEFLEAFRRYWLEDFDWRGCVDELNRYPQFIADVDGCAIHFVHVRGEGDRRRPLLMTHGWPGSHYEFWNMIEALAFPTRRGGDPSQAFDLIIPSLPGYAFSSKPTAVVGPERVAELWNSLMVDTLGYPRYLAHGGDWGSVVTAYLGLHHAPAVRGIHLNMSVLRSPLPAQNEDESDWLKLAGRGFRTFGGYSAVQSYKPNSLAWLGACNPLGQAAWILERFHDWSDLRNGDLASVFGLRRLATNIMLYVMTESFGSAMWLYNGMHLERSVTLAPGQRCLTPTGFAAFPHDAILPVPPRSRVELLYNLVHWSSFGEGGHFAAMEKPALLTRDLFAWAEKVWPTQASHA